MRQELGLVIDQFNWRTPLASAIVFSMVSRWFSIMGSTTALESTYIDFIGAAQSFLGGKVAGSGGFAQKFHNDPRS